MIADLKLIKWLLEESNVTRYRISKETKIPQTTLSDMATGKTDIKKIQFETAAALTEYAKKIEEEKKMTRKKINELAAKGFKQVWYNDRSTGRHYLITQAITNNLGNAEEILKFMEITQEDIEEKFGWEIDTDDLTTEIPEYLDIVENKNNLYTLEDGSQVWDEKWNGEIWHDNNTDYMPIYAINWTGKSDLDLIGMEISR
ncbi:hypothetical protein KCG48_10385 [Proteiniclasticum sp. BAD-10]|uniref:Uncharacterized protein n=1 Tax=Proteiniclasticum sediminis TaxID=2804028 RepID=A0A941CSE8_9CLOT|nr:hypothetical protein [Proteiniclasticum sediminis]MBR0576739.1 hypothetical protein [Proteiniclasticum sediminis]